MTDTWTDKHTFKQKDRQTDIHNKSALGLLVLNTLKRSLGYDNTKQQDPRMSSCPLTFTTLESRRCTAVDDIKNIFTY